jgi:hypothetical protein
MEAVANYLHFSQGRMTSPIMALLKDCNSCQQFPFALFDGISDEKRSLHH